MERRAGRLAHCGAAPLMRNGLDSHAAVLGAHAGGAAAADASLTPSASVQSSVRFVLAGSQLAGGWPCRQARRPGSGRYPSQLPSGWTVFHLPSTPWVHDIHPICIQRTEYIWRGLLRSKRDSFPRAPRRFVTPRRCLAGVRAPGELPILAYTAQSSMDRNSDWKHCVLLLCLLNAQPHSARVSLSVHGIIPCWMRRHAGGASEKMVFFAPNS